MSFAPVLPIGGYAGYAFLKRTLPAQSAAFAASAAMARDESYFRERVGTTDTAEALVADRRLLKVALGAFGLDDDIANRFLIRKVLEGGTLTEGALALKLSDTRYRELSAAFGYGDFTVPRTRLSDFADGILEDYRTRQFERAVGETQGAFRLALNAERELGSLAAKPSGDDTKWYTIMGSRPLREVFQTALGLPPSFAAIDLDQQLSVFKERTEKLFGDPGVAQFAQPATLDRLVRTYLLRAEAQASGGARSGASAALQLLRAAG